MKPELPTGETECWNCGCKVGYYLPASAQEASKPLWTGGVEYYVWLVEISDGNAPIYFQFEHDNDWTPDHNRAAHFGRREDAQRAIDHFGWTRAKPVEHAWPEAPTTKTSVNTTNGDKP